MYQLGFSNRLPRMGTAIRETHSILREHLKGQSLSGLNCNLRLGALFFHKHPRLRRWIPLQNARLRRVLADGSRDWSGDSISDKSRCRAAKAPMPYLRAGKRLLFLSEGVRQKCSSNRSPNVQGGLGSQNGADLRRICVAHCPLSVREPATKQTKRTEIYRDLSTMGQQVKQRPGA